MPIFVDFSSHCVLGLSLALVSNLLFGGVQYSIAVSQGLPVASILALQLSGASMGNMAAISVIVSVSAVLGVSNMALNVSHTFNNVTLN